MIADGDLAQPTDLAERDIYGFVTRNDGDGLPDNNCMLGGDSISPSFQTGDERGSVLTNLLSEEEEVYHEHGPA